MKPTRFILLAGFAFLLAACQPKSSSITILADGQVYSQNKTNRVPGDILAAAGITLGPEDRILYLGSFIRPDIALQEAKSYTLVVQRAVTLTIVAPEGQKTIHTSALTVGQALTEAGFSLYAADRIDPPAETSITGKLVVTYQPSRDVVVTVDGTHVRIRSAAATVGQALAEAGVPLIGLDTSWPDESAPVPTNGQIRVVRVVEAVTLTQKTIPFNTRTELSADLEIDQQALLQGGEPGLAIGRLRTRSEDRVQVSQQSESESVVRPPQDRILGIGTKIVIRTTTVDGVTIEYWRTLTLKATSYSPCRSADPNGACRYGTSSGLPVKHGVVAMVYSWYLLFGFEHIFVPGYGEAVVGDVGGGWPAGNHYWVDLGWSEEDYQPLMYENGVTVYFLTPVPANPGFILP
jgi:uncharacterized protein YabE (DUF348 family)